MHSATHMRDAFAAWVEAGSPDRVSVEVNYEEQEWPAERLLGRLTHCTDVMPRGLCDELGLHPGKSYAAAAQRILHSRSLAR